MPLFGSAPNIAKLKAKGDVLGLIQALGHKDANVHDAAVDALAQIGAPALEPLGAALKNENLEVRKRAVTALGLMRDARATKLLTTALKDADEALRGRVLMPLILKGAPSVQPLLLIMNELDQDGRDTVEGAIVAIGASAVEPLIAALKHEDQNARLYAASLLGTIGDKRAVEPLIAALGDEGGPVRQNAALSLGNMHDTRAVEALIAGLKDWNEPARRNCAWALGKIGNARAVEPLGVVLHDESSVVRDFAAKALSEIGGARALELLGWEGAISYRSLSSPVFQWAANDFVGSNQAWVDKVRQENDSAISWFNAQNLVPIPTFAGEKGAADYCFNMASQAQNSGNIQEAWAGYHQALRRFCSLMDEKMIGLTCFNLGKVYGNRGNWEMAQLMFLHSAYLASQSGEKKGYAWTLAYLGDTCERLGNKTLAKQFLSTALLIFKDVSPEDAEGVENNLRRLTES